MAPKRDSARRIGIPSSIGSRARPRSGVVVHYIGGSAVPRGRHSQCRAQVRGWHSYHRNGNGWAGIGYHFLVCHHGTIMVGRGLNRRGAHAPGVNASHVGVCFMLGGGQTPTSDQLAGFRRLRRWLDRKGVRASNVSPHSRHYATSCPGGHLRKRVRRNQWGSSEQEDPVPTYVSVSKTDESRREQLESGQWQQIYFDHNNSKGANDHHSDEGDFPSLTNGPSDYTGYVSLRLSGVPAGVECQARPVEVTKKRGGAYQVVEWDHPFEFAGTGGDTFVTVPVCGYVAKGNKLRVEVIHYGDNDVVPTVTGGEVRLQVWER